MTDYYNDTGDDWPTPWRASGRSIAGAALYDAIAEITHIRRQSWRTLAACLDSDPALFFPEREDMETPQTALEMCAECPVVAECAAYAHGAGERFGVWGGAVHSRNGRAA